MSTFSKTPASHPTFTQPLASNSPGFREVRNAALQDYTEAPHIQDKGLASAVRKLWAAIKKPKAALVKHWNSSKRLRKLVQPRTAQSVFPLGKPTSCLGAVSIANPASPSSLPTAIVQETVPEPLPLPESHLAATDSSISLSSLPATRPAPASVPDVGPPSNIINLGEQRSRPGAMTSAPSSEASTLQNSTFVNDDISRGPSGDQSPSISESERGTAANTSSAALAPHSSLVTCPRLQTSFGHLNVPGSDDEDSCSTIRGRGSSPVSAVDFHGMGGHFEDPPGSS